MSIFKAFAEELTEIVKEAAGGVGGMSMKLNRPKPYKLGGGTQSLKKAIGGIKPSGGKSQPLAAATAPASVRGTGKVTNAPAGDMALRLAPKTDGPSVANK